MQSILNENNADKHVLQLTLHVEFMYGTERVHLSTRELVHECICAKHSFFCGVKAEQVV